MLKIKAGSNIVDEIIKSDLNVDFVCGGKQKCGKCKVRLLSGKVNEIDKTEMKLLTLQEQNENIRLACFLKADTDICIENVDLKADIARMISTGLISDKTRKYILAVDLGTTTIEISIYDYESKKLLASIKQLNPQFQYGGDILTRAKYYTESNENKIQISNEIINLINSIDIIDQTIELYIAGNTIMEKIVVKQDVKDLLKPPYIVKNKEAIEINGQELGINMLDSGKVYFFPILESFVGGDIYSGLAYYLSENPNADNVMLIDIGTNCEIVYIKDKKYYVSSTPAGPAFEGADISCGMRAIEGALKDIRIDDTLEYNTIGNGQLKGICGSALIQMVGELLYNDIIDKTGLLQEKSLLFPLLNDKIKDKKFYVDDNVYLSQEDIRALQLAKAAVRGAIETMFDELDINVNTLKKILITGNFGKNLSKKSLMILGILPNIKNECFEFEENAVLKGLESEIRNKNILKNEKEILKNVVYINLSDSDVFKKNYIKYINF